MSARLTTEQSTLRKAVLFDLDGTLLDSIDLIVASWDHTVAVHGLSPPPELDIRQCIGRSLDDLFGALGLHEGTAAAAIRTYREHNLAHHDAGTAPYPGAAELVRALRSLGRPIAIVTGKRRVGAFRGLERLGLRDAFDVVIGADDTARGKPHPDPALLACERLRVAPESAWFVGDSVQDLRCARAAGTGSIAVTWGAMGEASLRAEAPDHVVSSMADLATLLGAHS